MKHKILISVFCFLIFSYQLTAEDTWIQSYQPFGLGYYEVEDVIVCSDGGYAINGWYEDEWELEQWAFIMKADSEGNLEWATKDTANGTFYAESHAMVEIDDGGFWVASQTLAGPGTLTKFNTNGEIVFNYPDYECWIKTMDKTDDGNIIVAGYSFPYHKPELRKITQDGEELWSNTFTLEGYNEHGWFNSVRTSSDGGYLLTGFIESEETNDDILVIKTDVNGDSLWARTYDGNQYVDEGLSIVEDNENNIMCAGYAGIAGWIGILWYLNGNGETICIEEISSTSGYFTASVTSFDNHFIALSVLNGDTNIYEFEEPFNVLWEYLYDGHIPQGDKSVQIIDTGFIFSNYTGYGGSDNNYINLIKTDSTGQVVDVHDYITPIKDLSLSCYPNPFNPTTTIEFSIQNDSNIELSIYNIKGQKIKTFSHNRFTKGSHSFIWNGSDESGKPVSSGIYYYKLNVNGETEDVKKCLLLK